MPTKSRLWYFACCILMVSCAGDHVGDREQAPDTLAVSPAPESEFADLLSVVITPENEEKVGFHVDYSDQLTEEERRLYRSAALRASMKAMQTGDTAMPLAGKTVGTVIAEERRYQQQHGEAGSQLLDRMENDSKRRRSPADTARNDSGRPTPIFPNKPAGGDR